MKYYAIYKIFTFSRDGGETYFSLSGLLIISTLRKELFE